MSLGYNDRLSEYEHKGAVGAVELFDSQEDAVEKTRALAELLASSKHTVFHTGAGISTSAGIPDFRGPMGVWTLEKQGKKPEVNMDFADATPTATHMAIVALYEAGLLQYVVTQNVDSLHLSSGYPSHSLAELHGNIFSERCSKCNKRVVRDFDIGTVGFKLSGRRCDDCKGPLADFCLDWEGALPEPDYELSKSHSRKADLSVALGTSLQMMPSREIPMMTVRRRKVAPGRLAIVNLQKTPYDKSASVVLRTRSDEVMVGVLGHLGLAFPVFERKVHVSIIIRTATSKTGKVRVNLRACNSAGPGIALPYVQMILVRTTEGDVVGTCELGKPFKCSCAINKGTKGVVLEFLLSPPAAWAELGPGSNVLESVSSPVIMLHEDKDTSIIQELLSLTVMKMDYNVKYGSELASKEKLDWEPKHANLPSKRRRLDVKTENEDGTNGTEA